MITRLSLRAYCNSEVFQRNNRFKQSYIDLNIVYINIYRYQEPVEIM